MLLTADLIAGAIGLIAPPAFDFIKKKFIKGSDDTPERTMGTLATTSPENMEGYARGMASLFEAKAKYFNRDVVGEISIYIRNLRAAIRPITVVGCLAAIICNGFGWFELSEGARISFELNVTSWLGTRISLT